MPHIRLHNGDHQPTPLGRCGRISISVSYSLCTQVTRHLVDDDMLQAYMTQAGSSTGAVEGVTGCDVDEEAVRESFARISALSSLGDCAGELELACSEAGLRCFIRCGFL